MVTDKAASVPGRNRKSIQRGILWDFWRLTTGFVLVFGGYYSLESLQSSLNADSGLGVISMLTLYGTSMLTGPFLATLVITKLRPKWTIAMCLWGPVILIASNYYPSKWTMVPSGVMMGFFYALLWPAHSVYFLELASIYSTASGRALSNILTWMFGVFYFFFELSKVIAGVASSLVLSQVSTSNTSFTTAEQNYSTEDHRRMYYVTYSPRNSSSLETFARFDTCGADYCPADDQLTVNLIRPPDRLVYTLLSIYLLLSLLGTLTVMCSVRNYKAVDRAGNTDVRVIIFRGLRLLHHWKILMLAPNYLVVGLAVSNITVDFTKSFVTCKLGIHMIGYVLLAYGLARTIFSFVGGYIQRMVHRSFPMIASHALLYGIVAVQWFWVPKEENLWVFYCISGIGGAGVSLMLISYSALTGMLFPAERESAYTAITFFDGLGRTFFFVMANLLCYRLKLCMLLATLLLASATYIALECLTRGTSNDSSGNAVEVRSTLEENESQSASLVNDITEKGDIVI